MEVEAVDEGRLGKILVPEGSEGVKVNAVIALLLEEGEDESALKNGSSQNGASQSGPAVSTAAAERPASDEGQPGPNRPIDAQPPQDRPPSPLANRLAEEIRREHL